MRKLSFFIALLCACALFSCKKAPKASPESWFEFKVDGGKAALLGLTEEGKQQTKIVIPAKYKDFPVVLIAPKSFEGNTLLASVTITEGVAMIGDSAFSGCTSLASVKISSSLTEIGGYAFEDCTSLSSVEILSSVTMIGDSAFSGCTSLTSVESPSSVMWIGEGAFSSCKLESVSVPSGAEIDRDAFDSATSVVRR